VETGGYAGDLLVSRTDGLDSRDAGLASAIVFGCLRRQAQLDFLIEQATSKPVARLDAAVRIAMRMGIFQLRHLERVPPHAVVSESVQLVKRARKASAAGLVNAVLRKVPRGAVEWPDRHVQFSMPAWLMEKWDREFGPETADGIAAAFLSAPEIYVRHPTAEASGVELEATDVPGCYRVVSGNPRGLRVQDIGSQSIVPLLELRPGMTFLDLCAAPGNKTAQALESGVTGIACDRYLHRLQNVSGCSRVVLDATRPLPLRASFDRILIDAPCSGTGTLGRNPEIRWRLRREDLDELHDRQIEILNHGLEHLRPGGRLVYSTCSLERRENEEVVAEARGARVLAVYRRTPGIDPGDGFFAAVLTV
jgi:16S rRNA (cytosine967-C5)-methyltransferase